MRGAREDVNLRRNFHRGPKINQAPRVDVVPTQIGAFTVLLLAVWFGVMAGAAEVLFLGILKFSGTLAASGSLDVDFGRRSGYIWLSPQVIWMAPVTAVCQLAVLGAGLVLLSKLKPSLVTLLPTAVLRFPWHA